MAGEGTVVVVEDEKDILHIIGDVLGDDGYRVVCVTNPADMNEIEDEVDPDLYLLDLMLPGTDGIQLARQLRLRNSTPMIAMSADPERLRRARASGLFEDVLPKPFDLVELIDRVEGYVE